MKIKLPHEKLFEICKEIAGSSVWALEMASDKDGKIFWCIYCDNKKIIKKLPKEFMQKEVKAFFCPRPKIKG